MDEAEIAFRALPSYSQEDRKPFLLGYELGVKTRQRPAPCKDYCEGQAFKSEIALLKSQYNDLARTALNSAAFANENNQTKIKKIEKLERELGLIYEAFSDMPVDIDEVVLEYMGG